MGAGILALLGVIISLASLGGAGIGFGIIIALIASVGLGVVGYLEYRKWKGIGGTYTPPAQSTPTAQAPPPAGPSSPSAPPPPPPPPPKK
jgi:hypothetical protein